MSIINQALSKTKELPEIESRYFASEEEFPSLLASRQFIKAVILTDVCRYRFYAIPKFCIIAEFFTLHYQAEALIRCTYEALLEKGHKTIPGFAVPFGTQTNQFERQGEHLVGNAYLFEKVFIDMTESLILALHETGFEKFILIINHSENQAALNVAAKDLANRYQIQCIVCDWVPPHNDFWPQVLKNAEHQGHGGEDETVCVMATVPELVHLENAKPYYAPEDECPVKMGGLYYYGGSVGVFTPVEKYLDHSPGYIGDPADATAEEGIVCLEQYAKWIAQAAEKYLF